MRGTIEERFYSKVDRDGPGGCWRWIGGTFPANSARYGSFNFRKKTITAHRMSFILSKGEIPVGLHVDHICRNTLCVNPDHLRAISPKENVLIGVGVTAVNHRKTKCGRGHSLSAENLILNRRGHRECRQCKRVTDAAYRFRKRGRKLGLEVKP